MSYNTSPLTIRLTALGALAVFAFSSLAIAGHHETHEAKGSDIVDTAVGAGDFNTLAAALTAADLVGTLKGEGPFTVFAPTDEAFAALPPGTVESLLKPENKDQLIAILSYHVVSGEVSSAEVVKLTEAQTLNGQNVSISSSYGKVKVDGATVIVADVEASNGVIHVIDRVILPKEG